MKEKPGMAIANKEHAEKESTEAKQRAAEAKHVAAEANQKAMETKAASVLHTYTCKHRNPGVTLYNDTGKGEYTVCIIKNICGWPNYRRIH